MRSRQTSIEPPRSRVASNPQALSISLFKLPINRVSRTALHQLEMLPKPPNGYKRSFIMSIGISPVFRQGRILSKAVDVWIGFRYGATVHAVPGTDSFLP